MTMATDSDGRPETCAHIAAGSLFSRFVVFFFSFPLKVPSSGGRWLGGVKVGGVCVRASSSCRNLHMLSLSCSRTAHRPPFTFSTVFISLSS